MDQLKPVQDKLAGVFKNLPSLPEQYKKSLAKYFEWIALFFGILQLFVVWGLWSVGRNVNELASFVNDYSRAFGVNPTAPSLGIFYFIALIALIASTIALLMAYPGLKARKKIGWDWLFLGTLINLVYGIASVFVNSNYGGGLGRLFSALFGSAISFYLLYQVRGQYTAHRATEKK